MRRTAWVALFACLALTGCNARTPEPEPADYLSGTVPIGVNSDLPGWSLYRNGVWSGFDIALGNWLAGELGFTPQYVPITTDERLKVLKREDSPVKLVISNFSITDVRRDEVDFAGPYLSDAQGLMTLTGSPIGTPADIEGRAVCVVLGSTGETRIFGAKINSRPENTLDRCVQRLRAREVDAVSTDQVILEGLASYASDLRVVPGMRVGSERYGIGLPNNRPELCEYLSAALTRFVDEEWTRKFGEYLPASVPGDRKPNSRVLDPCEPATP